jgi:hypothetical protein
MMESPALAATLCMTCLKPLPLLIRSAPSTGSTVAAQLDVLRSTVQPMHKAVRKARPLKTNPTPQPQPQQFLALKIGFHKSWDPVTNR